MAFPLIPVVTALLAGGSILPHSSGGLIVASAAGSYVGGTFMSTAAIANFLLTTAAAGSAAVGGAVIAAGTAISAAMSGVIGTAGWFGTTVGATGLTGLLMGWGVLPSTPIALPISIGVGIVLGGAVLCWLVRRRYGAMLRGIKRAVKAGKEYQFSEKEAKLVESLIRKSAPKNQGGGEPPALPS